MFDVWKNVLAEVEREVSPVNFNTWFADVNLIDAENGTVRLSVPNVFKQKQLQSKYTDIIMQSFRHNHIKCNSIEYIVQSTRNKTRGREITITKTKTEISGRTSTKAKFNTGLNPSYTLDNFVIGSNNDLAVSAAKSVVENPGKKFNPFFLYSGPGLGKTHLVQAIGNEIVRKNPQMRVLYTPVNHFYSEFIESIRTKGTDAFRKKYRKLDVLIIDDFQMIMKKEKSQEEFFNIFNDLHQANKQIILTSDRMPSQIKEIDERLASRLSWGGPIDMQMPSFEDRCAILQIKAEISGVEIEREAIEYIAENVKTNIRELEGEFNRVMAMADLKNISPWELISGGYVQTNSQASRKPITPRKVVETIAEYYGLTTDEMCGKSRVAHIKNARQVAMFTLSEELHMSTPKIAVEVGVKDHTTVMHGIKKIKSDIKLNFTLRDQLKEIQEKLYR